MSRIQSLSTNDIKDLRQKPYVNKISQILAFNSNKRNISVNKSNSIHDRLHGHPTKGKLIAKEQEMQARQSRG